MSKYNGRLVGYDRLYELVRATRQRATWPSLNSTGHGTTGDIFKLNRLLPNWGNIYHDRHSPEPGVVVVVLERHFSCGVILCVHLIPGIEVIFLPFLGL
jgi:hypothetical protein